MTMGGGVRFSATFLLYLIVLPRIDNAEADSRGGNFLYSALPPQEHYPVIEYEPPAENTTLNDLGEDAAVRPDFLYSSEQGHRVVVFYMHWCGHCQHLVPTYIALSRKMMELTNSAEVAEVEFYAVSCVPNKRLCNNENIVGVPTLRIYPAGHVKGIKADAAYMHPFELVRVLGIPFGSIGEMDKEEDEDLSKLKLPSRLKGHLKRKNHDPKTYRRQKTELYSDAYLSFHFAMRTGIFMANGPLERKARSALKDWLLLLQNSLPPSWNIQALLQGLISEFDALAQNEDKLLEILDRYPPQNREWSFACSHGEDGNGYTCGLWELFHIMTIGVVEFNEHAVSKSELASFHTEEVALKLRDYVENFFGCEVCRQHFLGAYDSCSLDRCHRLVKVAGEKRYWVQLPLWLFEEHNAVNVRLMKERLADENKVPSAQDEKDAHWPSRENCPKCWRDDGSHDENIVYHYLLSQYW
jgi:thiol oxidase